MKEFFQSILDNSRDRIKNPFIGSYLIAFIICNWQPLFYLLFSDSKIEWKIEIINERYSTPEALLWPLTLALFYTLLLPYVDLLFNLIVNKANKFTIDRQHEMILNNLNQKFSQAHLERKIADVKTGISDVENLQRKIIALEKEKEITSQENTNLINRNTTEVSQLKAELNTSKNSFNDLDREHNKIQELNQLLSSFSSTVDREIKVYFRKNLSLSQINDLRNHAAQDHPINDLPSFNPNYCTLLVRAGVYEFDKVKKRHFLTEQGKRFIKEID